MRVFFVLTAATLLAPFPAYAHPKLVSARPAPKATSMPTARLQLAFSERLLPRLSSADIIMISMPGMKMKAPKAIPARSRLAADGKTLQLTLARPLPRGTYRVDWRVVSADTHRVEGHYDFQVQ